MNRPMQLAALILVISMFAAAGWLEEKAVIFPEIAALACGAWVMEKPPWHFTPLKVWLSPTLAAFTGVALLKWLPTTPAVMICAAFILVALQLKAAGSAVIPSLSAAILPILTNVDTLLYPLSVGILTGVLALVHLAKGAPLPPLETFSKAPPLTAGGGKPAEVDPKSELSLWVKLSMGIALVAHLAVHTHALFMIAPPLVVTFVELSKPKSPLRRKVPQIMGLITLAAVAGALCVHFVHYVLHWPLWISAGITFGTVFVLYHLFSLSFPPAAAIALLPTIIPAGSLLQYPWHVLLGSTTFLLINFLCFRDREGVAAG